MCGCESWAVKKAERRSSDAFELLRVSRTARRSTLKEISAGCPLEGPMLKLKLQSSGHLMWRADSFEKTLMLGKIEGRRRRGRQRMRWLDGITTWWTWVWVDSGSWWWTGRPGCSSWGCKELDTTEWLNWTELNYTHSFLCCVWLFSHLNGRVESLRWVHKTFTVWYLLEKVYQPLL